MLTCINYALSVVARVLLSDLMRGPVMLQGRLLLFE